MRAKRRPRQEAASLARHNLHAFETLTTTPKEDLSRGLDLFERHPEIRAFDCVLAAVAIGHGASALLSADSGFGWVPGLTWIDPSSQDAVRLWAPGGTG